MQRNKVRREWKRVQDMLIKTMANKIRTWQLDGEESKEDLFQMLEASTTVLKAQYFEHSGGLDLETAARRKAEKAINELGKMVNKNIKEATAKNAAEEYIKKDLDFRKQIDQLERAMTTLGDKYIGKPNRYLTGSIEKAKKVLGGYTEALEASPNCSDINVDFLKVRLG